MCWSPWALQHNVAICGPFPTVSLQLQADTVIRDSGDAVSQKQCKNIVYLLYLSHCMTPYRSQITDEFRIALDS